MSVITQVKSSKDIQCKDNSFISIESSSFITDDVKSFSVTINSTTINFCSEDDLIKFKDAIVQTVYESLAPLRGNTR